MKSTLKKTTLVRSMNKPEMTTPLENTLNN